MRLQEYLAEITNIKLLEPAEEADLWTGFKLQQDMGCRRRLIEQYQPLVVKALSSWRGREEILMDLVQEGTVGLIEAVENFDPARGVAFSLYAIHRIRGRMLNYIEKETKMKPAVSLDSPASNSFGPSPADTLTDLSLPVAEIAEKNFLLDQMHAALNRLPVKERLALSSVVLEEQEPRQVASVLQITPSHLSRLQKQGIRRVRGMLSRLMGELKK